MSNSNTPGLAVVTGAAGGIGRAIARVLAEAGWDLLLNDLQTDESISTLLSTARQIGVHAEAVSGDVGEEAEVENLFQVAIDSMGRCPDLLINNAGVQTWKPLVELTLQEWNRTLKTNLTGCFLNTRCFARHLIREGKAGAVINIGSGCNKLAFPNLVDYAASKGGIEMLTKTSALELGPYNIRVNCLAPGAIENERTREELASYSASWSALTPLGRIGKPTDVANAVLLLADEKAGFISGETIAVDGGLFSRAIWPEPE